MKRFSVLNQTTGVVQGPFQSLEEAYERGMKDVRPGDSYSIRVVTGDVGSGAVVDEGRRPPERARRVARS
jgi:hypothetical protein